MSMFSRAEEALPVKEWRWKCVNERGGLFPGGTQCIQPNSTNSPIRRLTRDKLPDSLEDVDSFFGRERQDERIEVPIPPGSPLSLNGFFRFRDSIVSFGEELRSTSEFIPILGIFPEKKRRGDTPPTRESDTPVAGCIYLENLEMSNSCVYDHAPFFSLPEPVATPPDQSHSLSSTGTIFHSTLPSIGIWSKGACIGEGSQGRIYVGTSLTHGFNFAVKFILSDMDGLSLDSLTDEARTEIENMSSLNHPNIIRCFGAEATNHYLQIFMEMLPRGTLSKYIAEKRRLMENEASGITLQLLEAVYYLHSKRRRPLMHRDIKSSNILLMGDDHVFRDVPASFCPGIKLCDFGSSTSHIRDDVRSGRIKRISNTAVEVCSHSSPLISANTIDMKKLMSTSIKGTCNWMAPEVLKGEPYSGMCDIWSIGCVVIEMLTGELPWRSFDNPLAGMFNIMTSSETPLSYINDDVRAHLSPDAIDFLGRCLNRDVNCRWTAKRLLKHPWIKPRLEPIPGTPVGISIAPLPVTPDSPQRAII